MQAEFCFLTNTDLDKNLFLLEDFFANRWPLPAFLRKILFWPVILYRFNKDLLVFNFPINRLFL